jgi:hypothetical protein
MAAPAVASVGKAAAIRQLDAIAMSWSTAGGAAVRGVQSRAGSPAATTVSLGQRRASQGTRAVPITPVSSLRIGT